MEHQQPSPEALECMCSSEMPHREIYGQSCSVCACSLMSVFQTDTPQNTSFPRDTFPFPQQTAPQGSWYWTKLWVCWLGSLFLPHPHPQSSFLTQSFSVVVLAVLEQAFVGQIGLEFMEICLPLHPECQN